MPLSDIDLFVSIGDYDNARKLLENNKEEIHYRDNISGFPLLHILVFDFPKENDPNTQNYMNTLQVLMDYDINPMIKTLRPQALTATEYAEYIKKPQHLIEKLKEYEKKWKDTHSPMSSSDKSNNQTSHVKRRYTHQYNADQNAMAENSRTEGVQFFNQLS